MIVFFGANTEKFITGQSGKTWKIREEIINGKAYDVVRVCHTAPTPFNTHANKGQAFGEFLPQIFKKIFIPYKI